MSPSQRLSAIDELVTQFDASVSTTEAKLMDKLAEAAGKLLESPAYLAVIMREWKPEWVNLIQNLTTGLLSISDLNKEYFGALDVASDVLESAHSDLLTAIGVTDGGVVLESGYIATLLNDTSVGRQIISAITDAKLRKVTEPGFIAKLRPLVKGKESKGIIGRLLDTLDTQPHVEADRVVQQSVGIRADLRARLYLGGLRDSSRPFCIARNGKTFLVEEIERFGTSKDTYGGYADKSTGYFAGKPRNNYDPFTQCGGYGCKHALNVISNAEAMRRRDDLELVKGILRVKK